MESIKKYHTLSPSHSSLKKEEKEKMENALIEASKHNYRINKNKKTIISETVTQEDINNLSSNIKTLLCKYKGPELSEENVNQCDIMMAFLIQCVEDDEQHRNEEDVNTQYYTEVKRCYADKVYSFEFIRFKATKKAEGDIDIKIISSTEFLFNSYIKKSKSFDTNEFYNAMIFFIFIILMSNKKTNHLYTNYFFDTVAPYFIEKKLDELNQLDDEKTNVTGHNNSLLIKVINILDEVISKLKIEENIILDSSIISTEQLLGLKLNHIFSHIYPSYNRRIDVLILISKVADLILQYDYREYLDINIKSWEYYSKIDDLEVIIDYVLKNKENIKFRFVSKKYIVITQGNGYKTVIKQVFNIELYLNDNNKVVFENDIQCFKALFIFTSILALSDDIPIDEKKYIQNAMLKTIDKYFNEINYSTLDILNFAIPTKTFYDLYKVLYYNMNQSKEILQYLSEYRTFNNTKHLSLISEEFYMYIHPGRNLCEHFSNIFRNWNPSDTKYINRDSLLKLSKLIPELEQPLSLCNNFLTVNFSWRDWSLIYFGLIPEIKQTECKKKTIKFNIFNNYYHPTRVPVPMNLSVSNDVYQIYNMIVIIRKKLSGVKSIIDDSNIDNLLEEIFTTALKDYNDHIPILKKHKQWIISYIKSELLLENRHYNNHQQLTMSILGSSIENRQYMDRLIAKFPSADNIFIDTNKKLVKSSNNFKSLMMDMASNIHEESMHPEKSNSSALKSFYFILNVPQDKENSIQTLCIMVPSAVILNAGQSYGLYSRVKFMKTECLVFYIPLTTSNVKTSKIETPLYSFITSLWESLSSNSMDIIDANWQKCNPPQESYNIEESIASIFTTANIGSNNIYTIEKAMKEYDIVAETRGNNNNYKQEIKTKLPDGYNVCQLYEFKHNTTVNPKNKNQDCIDLNCKTQFSIELRVYDDCEIKYNVKKSLDRYLGTEEQIYDWNLNTIEDFLKKESSYIDNYIENIEPFLESKIIETNDWEEQLDQYKKQTNIIIASYKEDDSCQDPEQLNTSIYELKQCLKNLVDNMNDLIIQKLTDHLNVKIFPYSINHDIEDKDEASKKAENEEAVPPQYSTMMILYLITLHYLKKKLLIS